MPLALLYSSTIKATSTEEFFSALVQGFPLFNIRVILPNKKDLLS